MMLAALALAFGALMTAAERFFCPSLEMIAEYLRLPPAVAGATLLSFGNGAPDVFTQLAAVRQIGLPAIGMALSEPVGGGLFTSNIVFGAVVLSSTKSHQVEAHKAFILKDLLFYLLALVAILVAISDSKVEWYEATLLALSYVAYVAVTAWLARADEPVHVDLARHEVAPGEMIADASETDSLVDGDEERGVGDGSAFNSALRQPLLLPAGQHEGPRGPDGDGGPQAGDGAADEASEQLPERPPLAKVSPRGSWGGFMAPPQAAAAAAVAAADAEAAAPAPGALSAANGGGDGGGLPRIVEGITSSASAPQLSHHGEGGPRVLAEQRAAAAALLRHHNPAAECGVGTPLSTPQWSVGGTPKERGSRQHGARRSLKRRLQQPIMLFMKCTMPKIGLSQHYKYPRDKAALLPLTMPLLLVAIDRKSVV